MKIGITERGDPARDLSWTNTVRNCDGAIIITKAITNALAKNLLQLNQEGFPVILHATCTGYGGTILEPHVPNYAAQLTSIVHMIQHGFPQDHIILRIDPIIPTSEDVDTATKVLDAAASMNIIPGCRVRISILDEYRHVKARLAAAGLPQSCPGGSISPTPSSPMQSSSASSSSAAPRSISWTPSSCIRAASAMLTSGPWVCRSKTCL